MNRLLTAMLTCLLAGALASQEIVEAKGDKAQVATARATAAKSWAKQDWPAAGAAYQKLVELAPEDGEAWHHLGYALHIQGKLGDALKAHLQATRFEGWAPIGWYNAACVHALEGRTDDALTCLEKSVAAGFADREQIADDTDFDSLRSNERFQKIVKSMASAPSARAARAYVINTKRAGARLAFFSAGGSPGQLAIDYGQPVWKDEYAELVDSPKMVGRRWRCGQDFWTTFDTNLPLTIDGKRIPAGAYYLTLEHRDADTFVLAFNDTASIREQKLDAFVAHMSQGGIEIPLAMHKSEEQASSLEFGFTAGKQLEDATMELRFGPFALSTSIKIHLTEK